MEIAGINVKEGNVLIAKFADHTSYKTSPKYHMNWDWLMPVVERIESLHDDHHGYFGVHISSNSCSIQGTELWRAIQEYPSYGYVYMSDPNAILNTKIESTWYNVVKFIQWYNIFSAEKTR
jgi:hypothetical protein